jgi:hypothetical protein
VRRVELELVPPAEPAAIEAARRAAAAAGVGGEPWRTGSAWWQAGLADAIAGRSAEPVASDRYDVAPSPRSTRGATRA